MHQDLCETGIVSIKCLNKKICATCETNKFMLTAEMCFPHFTVNLCRNNKIHDNMELDLLPQGNSFFNFPLAQRSCKFLRDASAGRLDVTSFLVGHPAESSMSVTVRHF